MRKTDTEKEDKNAKRARIRALNDAFRKTFRGGRVMMTAGVAALPAKTQQAVFQKIQAFDAFDDENDPWGEHDLVGVEHEGQTFFAKIDYYDRDLSGHSEDATEWAPPAIQRATSRALAWGRIARADRLL